MSNNRGIDYGMGMTNIDRATGIRFGVVSINALGEYAWDGFEADYGPASCPKCGNEAVEGDSEIPLDELGEGETEAELQECDREELGYETLHHASGDYACDSCRILFDGEDAFGDEPCGHDCTDSEYTARVDSHNDVFIVRSPYYTRAQFCSPCAPGACYLENPCEEGEKAYCFGPDWYSDERPCPYPVYRVDTNELIYSPEASEETEASDE